MEEARATSGRAIAYCRVSSGDQRGGLDRQAIRVVEGANAAGLAVSEVVKEIGSGLNGKRRKLHRATSWPGSASTTWNWRAGAGRLSAGPNRLCP
ncbi:recombinase family protein [Nonomuraea wenchangensis]|uniref:recombinase family protein n=1 Tax=Nonomuraea wenchangensis TaxID=568860 RepID=UPI0033169157